MLDAFVAIAIGALLIVVAAFALHLAAKSFITPWLFTAILAGERAVLWGFEDLHVALASADRKAVADSLYSILPDVIVVHAVPIPVSFLKLFITQAAFESWVKDAYDRADAFILANETYLKSQIPSAA